MSSSPIAADVRFDVAFNAQIAAAAIIPAVLSHKEEKKKERSEGSCWNPSIHDPEI